MLRNKLIGVGVLFLFCIFCFVADSQAEEGFVYDSKGERDPFMPLVTADGRLLKIGQKEQAKGISLEGIIYDKEGGSYAIVNGDVVRAGETIEDFQILKIESDRVIFIKNGEPIEVELDKEE